MWNVNRCSSILGIILIVGLCELALFGQANGQTSLNSTFCYTCQGSNCNVSVPELGLVNCGSQQEDCATIFNATGTVVERGCSNFLSFGANATCTNFADRLCFTCDSSGCNIGTNLDQYIDCLLCDSSLNNNCVWNPANSSITTIKCYEECLVALLPIATDTNSSTFETYRGCASDLPNLGIDSCNNSLPDGVCWTCNQSNCNSFNEPANRLTCNFCSNNACNETFSQVCLNYRSDDKCVYVFNNDSTISSLTCASDFDSGAINYMTAMGSLVQCSGANCNTLANTPNVTKNPMSCISCSSQHNDLCATNPNLVNTTEECDELNTMCSMRVTIEGYTIRGCLASLQPVVFMECYSGSALCSSCNSTNCNNQIFPADRLSCYRCNTLNDPTCGTNSTNISICPDFNPEEFCMQYWNNNVTYRGCWSDFPGCLQECSICTTDGCNNSTLTGKSITIQATAMLLGASLFVTASINRLRF